MADCDAFRLDPDWIQRSMLNRYSIEQIEAATGELLNLNYLKFDAEKGRYTPAQSYIQKLDSSSNYFLRRFHYECLAMAKNAIDGQEMKERYLIASTVAIPENSFPRIRQKVTAFLDNLVRAELRSEKKSEVVQVNIQLLRTARLADEMQIKDSTINILGRSNPAETNPIDLQPKGTVEPSSVVGVASKDNNDV